jgi:hypothetical protein
MVELLSGLALVLAAGAVWFSSGAHRRVARRTEGFVRAHMQAALKEATAATGQAAAVRRRVLALEDEVKALRRALDEPARRPSAMGRRDDAPEAADPVAATGVH